MTPTNHTTTARPPRFTAARLFRRAFTCLALAFGLLAPLPAHAGAVGGSGSVNFQSNGTMPVHEYDPENPGYSPAMIRDYFGLSAPPTITADFASSKVVVLTLMAPAGQKIRINSPPGAGNSRLNFGFYVDSTTPPLASGGTISPVWENVEGSPPVSASASSVLGSYNGKPYANFDLPFSGSLAFTKLTVTLTFPPTTSGSYTNYGLNSVAATFISETSATSDPGLSVSFEPFAGPPTVTTPASVNLTATTATLGGNVTSDGGSAITERGVVYSLTSADADPLIGDPAVAKLTASGTTGLFTANVTGLTAGSSYSFKAYASNGNGTGYTSVATFSYAPEIAVEQPANANLTSGSSTVAFGDALIGTSVTRTFTVKNSGDGPLTLGAITFTGANAGDFTVTTPPASPVAATNGSTTFTVTYRASATGAASATLSLPNNDTTGSEAPFVISLSGTGTATGIVASFASPGFVTGGWAQEDTFTIGEVGTSGNKWPAAESPDKATDGNVETKFLIFQSNGAGFLLRPADATIAYNRLSLTTANDAPERDPAYFYLYGLTIAPATTSGTQIPMGGGSIEIASGTLNLPDARKAGPTVVQFRNTTAYAAYLLVFADVKNSTTTNLTQIAEVKLSQGMTVPNQVTMGTARGGRLSGSTFTFGTAGLSNPGNNWPAGQSPDNALDGDVSANFLLFQNNGMGLIASPTRGDTVVNQLSFWTAEDAPERDPTSYAIYGFNTAITQTSGTLTVGTPIATGSLTLPTTRGAGPTTVNFPNTTPYNSYLVVFPSVKNNPATNLTQISEVAFANVPQNTAPLLGASQFGVITSTSMSFTADVTSDGGSPIIERGVVYSVESVNSAPLIGGSSVTKITSTGTTGVLTMSLTGLTPGTTYTFRAYAINGVGTSYNTLRPFTTPATAPLVSEPTSASITATTATLGGNVTSNGFSSITQRGVVFSLTSDNNNPVIGGLGVTQVSSITDETDVLTWQVTGLTASSGYSFKAYATNGVGTSYTSVATFTTTAPPATAPLVSAPTVTSVTSSSATLGGNVTGDGGSTITARGVVFSRPSVNPDPLVGGFGVSNLTTSATTGVFTVTFSGFTASTDYIFKAYATNAAGTTYTTPVSTFTTAAANTTPTGITLSNATLAENNAPGATIGTLTATDPDAGQTHTFTLFLGESGPLDNAAFTISGNALTLNAAADYETKSSYRVGMIATDNGSPPYYVYEEFIITITNENDAPSVTSPTSTSVTAISATLGGNVTADGGSDITEHGVVYSLTSEDSDPNIGDPSVIHIVGGAQLGVFAVEASGLTLNSNYSFKAYATNSVGTSYTSVASFITVPTAAEISVRIYGRGGIEIFTPHTEDLGEIEVGTQSGLLVRILNTGDLPLNLSSVALTGAPEFSIEEPAVSPVAGGDETYLIVRVDPTTIGVKTATLTIASNDSDEPSFTLNLTATGITAPPTFSGYAFSTKKNTLATVAAAKILARAADTDGGTLALTAVSAASAQGGSVSLSSGNVRYTPLANFTGLDTFTVTISDGQGGSVVGIITVNVTAGTGVSQNRAQLTVLPGGNVALLFMGIPGQQYAIQRSTDLENWSTVDTVTAAANGTIPYTDTNPPPGGSAFYRTAIPNG